MERDRRPPRRRNDTNWKAILAVSGGVMLVWFIIANSRQVEVTWWVFTTSTSLIVVILVSALLGAGLTYLFTRVRPAGRPERAPRDRDPGQGAR